MDVVFNQSVVNNALCNIRDEIVSQDLVELTLFYIDVIKHAPMYDGSHYLGQKINYEPESDQIIIDEIVKRVNIQDLIKN